MPVVSVRYRFSARLPAPPPAAYRWATDFRGDDLVASGRGARKVTWLAPDAVLLTDVPPKGRRREAKTRLVRLYPDRRSWTNTHVSGPYRHSQFLYEIVPAGRRASRLEFTGLQLVRFARTPTPGAVAAMGRTLAREDASLWRVLVRAMARDLGAGAARRPRRRVGRALRRRRRSSP
jgi:hypothetical protein